MISLLEFWEQGSTASIILLKNKFLEKKIYLTFNPFRKHLLFQKLKSYIYNEYYIKKVQFKWVLEIDFENQI